MVYIVARHKKKRKMAGVVKIKEREYHAEYGDCILANAENGSITVVLPKPINPMDFLPSLEELGELENRTKILRSMFVYVKKIDKTPNEVVIVAPQSSIDGEEKIVLKKWLEDVRLTLAPDGNWYIM